MFNASTKKTGNVFEILLGLEKLKWNPVWNFIHWMCLPAQSHGFDIEFREKISLYACGVIIPNMRVIQGFRVESADRDFCDWAALALAAPGEDPPYEFLLLMDDIDHTSPDESKKIHNLVCYSQNSRELVPEGYLRILILTNLKDTSRLHKLRKSLGSELEGSLGAFAWNLLPLSTLGDWVEELLPKANSDLKYLLQSFIEWARSA